MLTITEGLAELKTMEKRIAKKRESIQMYLVRQDGIKDSIKDEGGSIEFVRKEMQAITDLEYRHVQIRVAIQKTNQATMVTIDEDTKIIAEWLTWRKEIAPGSQGFVTKLRKQLVDAKTQAQTKGWGVAQPGVEAPSPLALVVNISESDLARDAEHFETVLGTLDGKLSLLNATTLIGIE